MFGICQHPIRNRNGERLHLANEQKEQQDEQRADRN